MVVMLCGSFKDTGGWEQPAVRSPKAHKLIKFTESTQALKSSKKRRGPSEITMKPKAPREPPAVPRQYPGVSGVRGTAPGPFWWPRGEKRVMENVGSGSNFDEQLGTRYHCLFFISHLSIWEFAGWSAPSNLPIREFLGSRSEQISDR